MKRRAVSICAIALATAVLAACASPAPSPRVARAEPRPAAVWIADVAVLDVATGERTPARDVLVANGRIAAITRSGVATAPAGALVIPGSGATLVPGLVDMHGHVYASSNPVWAGGLPDPEANLRAYLYSGVTTVFDPGDSSRDAFERRERVARGELVGPHIYTAGPIHTAPDGHPIALVREFAPWWIGWYLAPRVAVAVDSPEEANRAIDRLAEHHPDAVKIAIDEIPLGAPRMRPEVARAIAERARSHGLRTVAHIGTTRDAVIAAESGVALWMHGVYKERIPDDQIAVLASYHIPMVATIEVFDSYARLRSGPREATALERETVPAALLDSFYPPPEGFSAGFAHVVAGAERAGGPVSDRERAPPARRRRRDLRGQRYAVGRLSGSGPAPRARKPRARGPHPDRGDPRRDARAGALSRESRGPRLGQRRGRPARRSPARRRRSDARRRGALGDPHRAAGRRADRAHARGESDASGGCGRRTVFVIHEDRRRPRARLGRREALVLVVGRPEHGLIFAQLPSASRSQPSRFALIARLGASIART